MSESVEPVSAELEGLYHAARTQAGPSAEQAARVVSRLDASLAMLAPAAPVSAAAGAGVSAPGGLLRRMAPYVLTFTAGLGIGGVVVRTMLEAERHSRGPVVVDVAQSPVRVPSAEKPLENPVGPPAIQAPPPVVARVVRPMTAPTKGAAPQAASSLDEERTLLEPARTALARGDPVSCLEVLAVHLARFPAGVLSEEREALAVQALVASGQGPAARARSVTFQAKYPDSMLLPVVDAALTTIP